MSAVLKDAKPVLTPIVAAISHLSVVKTETDTPASAVEVITAHSTIRYATYAEFFRSKLNVRRKKASMQEGNPKFEELVSLIAAQGVLQNLIAYEEVVKGEKTGRKGVVAGGRRLAAVGVCIARGLLPEDYMIPYLVVTEDEAVAVSLSENSGREDMHAADVALAMLELFNRGVSVDDIALSFGTDELAVRRRLKLANVSPKLLDLYRDDKLNSDVISAFAITDDHKQQEMAYKTLSETHRLSAWRVREMLTAQHINAREDHVAQFVGIDAYEKAGGEVVRDLFSNNGDGYIKDAALLETLAAEKLAKKVARVKEEGHAWVEVRVRFSKGDLSEFAAVRDVTRSPTPEEKAEYEQIKADIAKLETEQAKYEDDDTEEGESKYDELEAQIDDLRSRANAIKASLSGVHEADKALAGAIVTIDQFGQAFVYRGLIRPDDKPKMEKIAKAEPLDTADAANDASMNGRTAHSDRLTHVLTSHRTAALQAEMLQRPEVALVVTTHALACKVFNIKTGYVRTRLSGIDMETPKLADEVEGTAAQAALDAKREAIESQLPEYCDEASLLAWMLEQPMDVTYDILAYCTALSLDATLRRETTKTAAFDQLAKAVNLDMRNWWQPTATTYFNHVSKGRMIEVVSEAVSAEAAAPLEKSKKGEAAVAAEQLVAGKGWLPEMLRTA
ncbi:MAG TPA: ParB/RepB/Spo0J family partition protein [Noviherbaspirillum sp.]|nr:ParB/RepB/Spo0J family partition protein [Noviherbaspirillum sp.]